MSESSFWGVTVPRVMSIYATGIFVVMWIGFLVALLVNREWLDLLWNWTQTLPLVLKIIAWMIFLPVMVGLWIWQSSWSLLLRLVSLVGLIGWTLLAVSSLYKAFR